jgi:hypothetical protein
MIRAALRANMAAACALLAAVLWSTYAPAARAQGACDSPAVKDYIADFGGSRTPPPAAWRACVDSLGPDPLKDYKEPVLQSFAALRARTGEARDPVDAEKQLFQGGDRMAITQSVLEGWRENLCTQRPAQRFDCTFYRALLGSLTWIVIDRSGRLQEACVAPVVRLQTALRGGPNWPAVESALLAFKDISLWPSPGRKGVTLSGLRDKASGLSAVDLQGACPEIRNLAMDSGYWPGISDRLKPRFVVRVPPDCALGVCQAVREWSGTPTPEVWGRVRQGFQADLAATRHRLDAPRQALPDVTAWSVVETRLAGLGVLVDSLSGAKDPNGRDMVPQVEKGLADLGYLSKLTNSLEDLVAYRKALRSLLGGDAAQARAAVRERRNWSQAPHLVAAYVAAGYWEKGPAGKSAACKEGGLHCSDPDVEAELARIAGILMPGDGALRP